MARQADNGGGDRSRQYTQRELAQRAAQAKQQEAADRLAERNARQDAAAANTNAARDNFHNE